MNDPGGILSNSKSPQDRCWARCGAVGSFRRALVVAHMANVETCSSLVAKHTRHIACTLRICIFGFGYFRLALKAPGQVRKFPNEFADCVSGYMLPTTIHMVRVYNRAMLLRGCARVCMFMRQWLVGHMVPPYTPQTPPRACRCSHSSGVR